MIHVRISLVIAAFVTSSGGSTPSAHAESESGQVASARKKPKKATRTKKPRKAKKPRSRGAAQATPIEALPPSPPEPVAESVEAAPTPAMEPPSSTDAVAAPASPIGASSAAPLGTSDTLSTTKRSQGLVRSPARIRIGVESGPFWRQLRYRDAINGDLRKYDLGAGSIGAEIMLRPFARFGLELGAAAELAVGVNGSRSPEMDVYQTRSSEWQGTIGYVFGSRDVQARVMGGVGEHRFVVEDEMAPGGELVPDTTYRFVRVAARVGYQLHRRLAVAGGLGWRQLIGTGALTSDAWFPRATGNGIDASLSIEIAITRTLRAHVGGELRRYFFAMHPEVGDTLIVGGALDQYVGITAGLTLGVL